MHCKGCWAGTYGHKYSLSFEDMDKIIMEGKELGVYLYMLTGGEPLVKKKEILELAKKHHDEVQKLGNIAFQLSIGEYLRPRMNSYIC